jgi:hypothetical protein
MSQTGDHSMRKRPRTVFIGTQVLSGMVAVLSSFSAGAQALKVTPKQSNPNIILGTLTVSATPSQVTFNLSSGKAVVGNNPVNITTSWSGISVISSVSLYGFFTNSSAALTGNTGGNLIPTSAVFGQMTTGLPTAYTAFTQTNPLGGAGASLKLFTQSILIGVNGNRTDALGLKIDLTSLPKLPADKYTGTLILQAQVF